MKKTLLILTVLTVLFSSCRVFRTESTKTESRDTLIVRDSLRITDSVRVRDSVDIRVRDSVRVLPESKILNITKQLCDSLGNIKPIDTWVGTGHHRVHIWTNKDGDLLVESKVDSLVNRVSEYREYHERDSLAFRQVTHERDSLKSVLQRYESNKKSVQKPLIAWWQWFGAGIGIGLILPLLLRLYFRKRP